MIKVWKHLDYQATKYKFVFPKNEPNRKEAPPTWELCSVLTDSELEQFARRCFEAAMPRLSKDYTEKVADGTMTPELAREAFKELMGLK